MSEPSPPWFPGQFGRPDSGAPLGAGAPYTGDPYAEPTAAEPYAPAALPGQVTDPYGEVPAPPPSAPDAASWLADGGAGRGVDGGAAWGAMGTGAARAVGGDEAAPTAGEDGRGTAPGPATGYEDFYEPGTVTRSHLRRPGRRRRSGRRHGPRGQTAGRKTRRSGTPGSDIADTADAAQVADPPGRITVVPGGTAGGAGATSEADRDTSPSTVAGFLSTLGGRLAGLIDRRDGPPQPDDATGRRDGPSQPDDPTGRTGRDGSASPQQRPGAWLAALVVVGTVAVGVVVAMLVARDPAPPAADPAPTASPTAPATPGPTPDPLPSPTVVTPPPGEVAVGTTVSEGPFDVEVLGVSAGLEKLAGATAAATAEGEFVVVRLRVTATRPGPAYFVDIDQRLLDPAGGEHAPDPAAAMAVDGNRLWFAELDGGESAEGVVVFDVPSGTVPATLVVHSSDEGAGTRVQLPTP
ncbi:DUF4352 domain-containing protein [Georgenia sp. EYE_87]|uniref:DUF4352 domain-containing protein n=1 Tax=Georgenia sp. EYE_87 TaxID=2853448 RepID=UPI0027E24CE2|nr:DUF4352 domain-containing protein [Georgenia sp. EYE_87]MCK6211234.1 DUF4352 domain-containing protein [Georgenia sp. EYE_87]